MRLGEKETREGKRREDKRGAQVGKSKMSCKGAKRGHTNYKMIQTATARQCDLNSQEQLPGRQADTRGIRIRLLF